MRTWSLFTCVALGCTSPPPASTTPEARAEAKPHAPAAASSPRPTSATAPPPVTAIHEPQKRAGDPSDAHEHAAGHAHHHGGGYQMDFSEVERFARHFDDPSRDAWQRPAQVVKLMQLQPGQVVADIGAGTGYFLPHLAQAVGPKGRVVALDVEPNMVEFMRRRVQASGWSQVSAGTVLPDDPKLQPASVDRILIVNTWHHIGQRPVYAAKLAQALKRGGSVWIVDFTRESDIGPPADHRLSAEEVLTELAAGGLNATVVTEETLPKQYVVRGSLER